MDDDDEKDDLKVHDSNFLIVYCVGHPDTLTGGDTYQIKPNICRKKLIFFILVQTQENSNCLPAIVLALSSSRHALT